MRLDAHFQNMIFQRRTRTEFDLHVGKIQVSGEMNCNASLFSFFLSTSQQIEREDGYA